jgi:hypothetical protein
MRSPLRKELHRHWAALRRRGSVDEAAVTLRDLLRVHGTSVVASIDAVLFERGEFLRHLPDELEHRCETGGFESVDRFLTGFDRTATALQSAYEELAVFITDDFSPTL